MLSQALADRLRIDGTRHGRKQSLFARRYAPPTADERRQVELIRSSPLFDAAWYLRNYHDVVRSGEEPALHFLRYPTRPIRAPGPDFDAARYLDAHPEVLAEGVNPLVHFLLSEEGRRADTLPTPDPMTPDLETGRRRCADFLAGWLPFVQRWQRVDRDDPARARRLVERVLVEGFPEPRTNRRPDRDAELRCAMAVVRASGALRRGRVRRGQQARQPLDRPPGRPAPRTSSTRAGVTCARPASTSTCGGTRAATSTRRPRRSTRCCTTCSSGAARGSSPCPGPPAERTPTRYAEGNVPRRACLFAGYDRDGIIDDYVVHYLRELARSRRRLLPRRRRARARRAGQARRASPPGAWSIPHAAYDFGSWSLLARDLVGWDRLDGYDEVVLANDSCFLVRPLDEVFARDGRSRLRLVEPAGHVDGVQRGRRRRRRLDAARRRPGASCSAPGAGPTCSTCT